MNKNRVANRQLFAMLVACSTIVGVVRAEWLDESAVRTAAEAFPTRNAIGASVLKGRSLKSLVARDALWVACYEPSGYAVFSGSDLVGPVVAFSDKDFAEPREGEAFYDVLAGASDGCRAAEHGEETADGLRRRARWQKLVMKQRTLFMSKSDTAAEHAIVQPFMTMHWNQWQPYNDFSPVHDASATGAYRGRVPCGCIATATAQVFDYWKWPARIDDVRTYDHYFSNEVAGVGTYATRFDGHVPIDWNAFNDTYESYSGGYDLRGNVAETVRYPVARLVHFCDSIAEMSFKPSGSSANFSTIVRNSPWYVGGEHYNLDNDYDKAVAAARADIEARRPVLVSIPGHAVVGHGWSEDGETSYIYLNYGWGESNDGYYNLDDRDSDSKIKEVWTCFKPRPKPQLDPLPKALFESDPVTLRWHFPDCYTNDLAGFTIYKQRIGDGAEEDFFDDFSASMGTSTSTEDIYVGNESQFSDTENLLLYTKAFATGEYVFDGTYTLTSASVLTFKILSYLANWTTYEIQASFNGGEWRTICVPALELAVQTATGWSAPTPTWKDVRVYMGDHGGASVRFRVAKGKSGTSYFPNGRILLDDFRVTRVLKPDMPSMIIVDPSLREYTFYGSYDDIQPGASYTFAVRPDMASTSVEGEMSDTIMTSIAGARMMPLSGEETYTTQDLTFTTIDESGVWSYFGNVTSVDGVCDDWNPYVGAQCKITAAIPGRLTENSIVSFAWRSDNYYKTGSEYDTITTRFIGEDGTVHNVETFNNYGQTGGQRLNNVPLGDYAGLSGKVEVEMVHSGDRYPGTCVVEGVQVLNVDVRSTPDVMWGETTVTANAAPEITTITHSKSKVVDGLFAECSMGTNVFTVECSSSVESLDAHVSASSYFPDDAITVQNRGGGIFTVKVDASGIPYWAERTRAILTLAATNANGSASYRDVSLRFSSETESDTGDEPTGPVFTIEDGVLTAVELNGATEVMIPDEVTSIGIRAFFDCDGMTSVTIPDSVTNIMEYAFFGCHSLESIVIPASVKSVGESAFEYCRNLTNIVVCAGDIGSRAFMDCCDYETKLVLGEGVTSIGDYSFQGCKGIAELTIPASVTNVSWSAFDSCDITNMTVNSERAFCINLDGFFLEKVTLGDGVVYVDDGFCGGCWRLYSLKIGQSVQTLGQYAFSQCYSLNDVYIPDGVREVGDYAFERSVSLTNVVFGCGVTNIGTGVFSGCEALERIVFNGDAPMMGASFDYVSSECTAYVRRDSTGWGVYIPGTWNGIWIAYIGEDFHLSTSIAFNGEPTRSVFGEGEVAYLDLGVNFPYVDDGFIFLETANPDDLAVISATPTTNGVYIAGGEVQVPESQPIEFLDGDRSITLRAVLCGDNDPSTRIADYTNGTISVTITNVPPCVTSVTIDGQHVAEYGQTVGAVITGDPVSFLAVVSDVTADLYAAGGDAMSVKWVIDGSVYETRGDPSTNAIVHTFQSAKSAAQVNVFAKDKDMPGYPASPNFTVYVPVVERPGVLLSVGSDTFEETDVASTKAYVDVMLSEGASENLTVRLAVPQAMDGGFLHLQAQSGSVEEVGPGEYDIMFDAGLTGRRIYFGTMDGTHGTGIGLELNARVVTDSVNSSGVKWCDYYTAAEPAAVRVRNVAPAIVLPSESEESHTNNVAENAPYPVQYACRDVSADLEAGIKVEMFVDGMKMFATNVHDTATRSHDIAFSSAGGHLVSVAFSDKDGATMRRNMHFFVEPTTASIAFHGEPLRSVFGEGEVAYLDLGVNFPYDDNGFIFLETADPDDLSVISAMPTTNGVYIARGEVQSSEPQPIEFLDGDRSISLRAVLCGGNDPSTRIKGYASGEISVTVTNVPPHVTSVTVGGRHVVGHGQTVDAVPVGAPVSFSAVVSDVTADLYAVGGDAMSVKWDIDGTIYETRGDPSTNAVVHAFQNPKSATQVSVFAKDKDMPDYPASPSFTVCVPVVERPGVSLSVGSDVFDETDVASTKAHIDVMLSESASENLTVRLAVPQAMDGGFLHLQAQSGSVEEVGPGEYDIMFDAGLTGRRIYFGTMDGTHGTGIGLELNARVVTDSVNSMGMKWCDYYTVAEPVFVRVSNVAPAMVLPLESDESQTNNATVNVPYPVQYACSDVSADLDAGVKVEIYVDGMMLFATNVYDTATRSHDIAFSSAGGHAVSVAFIDKDGATVRMDLHFNVAPKAGLLCFAESYSWVDEASNAVVRVYGGNATSAASANVYLTYNTASAADLDLAKGTVDGATPKGGLKFPLPLSWAKGEIGEKVIAIPVKADKTVEDDESFTLQLGDAQGMELGEDRVCTVTILDANDKTLKTTVTPYKPKNGEKVSTNSVTVASGNAKGGFVSGTGEYTAGSKLTLTAEARPGWSFVGWRLGSTDGSPVQGGDILSTKAKWQIVVTNDEEYVAVFEKIPCVRGLADPVEGGKVSGSGLCDKGKKVTLKATANKNFTFLGWRQGTGNGYVATSSSLVIDRSAKPAASSKTSTTITNLTGDVTYYAVFKSDPMVTVFVEATDGKGDAPTGKGAGKYVAGAIAGEGKYAPGKTKIALKAAANNGYVFSGWYEAGGKLLTKDATYTIAAMGESDVEYVARFITADEDKRSIDTVVDGWTLTPWVSKTETNALRTNIWAGVYMEWHVAASARSATTIKVAGLPAGLKFADKPVTSKVGTGNTAVTVTNVQANTIYGAPSAASKTTTDKKTGKATVTPSEVKVTVTTAGKSSQTYQIDTVVDALPSWAFGTFNGGWDPEGAATSGGQVSLTVSAAGKVSGKALGDGLTYTLAAPYYSGFAAIDDGDGVSSNFLADITASWSYKEGNKTVKANEVIKLTVQDNGIGGYAAVDDWFKAYTVNWKVEPWNELGKKFDKKTQFYAIRKDGSIIDGDEAATVALDEDVIGRVALKFTATGTASVAGEFVTGYNEKTKKYTTVKASGAVTLVPVDKDTVSVFIYLTPKDLQPHVRILKISIP